MKTAGLIAVLYLAFTLAMYLGQRKLQYFPDTRTVAPVARGLTGFEAIEIATADGERLAAWYTPPGGAAPGGAGPVIVYLQGNAQSIEARHERFAHFRAEGYGVLAVNYRGYGGSTGAPSEAGLVADGRGAIAFLAARDIGRERIILYGESLGSGVAVQLAADPETRPGAVILEAPFASAADIARRRYWFLPVGFLMKDQYRSIDFAPAADVPVFVHHGDRDDVIPIGEGRRLFQAFPGPKRFHQVAGGTHVAPLTLEIWQAIVAFLAEHGMAAPGG